MNWTRWVSSCRQTQSRKSRRLDGELALDLDDVRRDEEQPARALAERVVLAEHAPGEEPEQAADLRAVTLLPTAETAVEGRRSRRANASVTTGASRARKASAFARAQPGRSTTRTPSPGVADSPVTAATCGAARTAAARSSPTTAAASSWGTWGPGRPTSAAARAARSQSTSRSTGSGPGAGSSSRCALMAPPYVPRCGPAVRRVPRPATGSRSRRGRRRWSPGRPGRRRSGRPGRRRR